MPESHTPHTSLAPFFEAPIGSHGKCARFSGSIAIDEHDICMAGGMIVAFEDMRYYIPVTNQKEG